MISPKLPLGCRLIPGFDFYCVSNIGDVFSCRSGGRGMRITNWRKMPLRTKVDKNGYKKFTVALTVNDQSKHHTVSRLVLQAFVGPCPEGMQCCHNDGNSLNNELSNLRWDTPSSNQLDRINHGSENVGANWRGEGNPKAKLNRNDVLRIRKMAKDGFANDVIAKEFGIAKGYVWNLKSNLTWRHIAC